MFDQPETPPKDSPELLMRGSDYCNWIVYKLGRADDIEVKEPEQALHSSCQEQEQGSG